MIYSLPHTHAPIDQGDIVDGCPIVKIKRFDLRTPAAPEVTCTNQPVVVLTQTCDIVTQKTERIVAALVYTAHDLVTRNTVKAHDVRGPIRAGRVFGWYFLPAARELELEESIVDLRQLITLPIEVIHELVASGKRKARIQPLFREHLAKHFADTYSRIGLPEPYATE